MATAGAAPAGLTDIPSRVHITGKLSPAALPVCEHAAVQWKVMRSWQQNFETVLYVNTTAVSLAKLLTVCDACASGQSGGPALV